MAGTGRNVDREELVESLRAINIYGSQFLQVTSLPAVIVSYRQSVNPTPTNRSIFSISKLVSEIKDVQRKHGILSLQHPGFWAWFNPLDGGIRILISFLHTMVEDYFGLPIVTSVSGASAIRNENSGYFNGWQSALSKVGLCVLQAIILRPIDLARNRLICQYPNAAGRFKYTGLLSTLSSLRNENYGFTSKALVPSILATLAEDFTSSTFETMKPSVSLLKRYTSTTNGLLNGALHGLSLAVDNIARWGLVLAITHPLEVITKRLDVQGAGVIPHVTNYTSWTDCASSIWREEGLSGFYKGVVAEFVAHVALVVVVETLCDLAISATFGPPPALVSLAEAREAEDDSSSGSQ